MNSRDVLQTVFGLVTATLLVVVGGKWPTNPQIISGELNPVETIALAPEQAIAVATNNLEVIENGYRLHHPRHIAEFTTSGLQFTPRRGGPTWAWQLTFVGAYDAPLANVEVGAVRPVSKQRGIVAYLRGGVVEQYLARHDTIEQQFIIPQPPTLDGLDLVIAGQVTSLGTFATSREGWIWQTAEGTVRLGNVRVYDAAGQSLPAAMAVTAEETRITVNGAALAQATYPVTIDPEIGANDFRLSDMGPDGDPDYDALEPAVAYNSMNNEYLVVWHGEDNTGSLVADEWEIYGQRVDAATGAEVGPNDFRLSDMGPDGDPSYGAFNPMVAYNSVANEYLVVWYADDNTGSLVDDEYEVFGQRVSASGAEMGPNDFRLSDMGPDGDPNYMGVLPVVAYNSTANEYLVVWWGEDNTGSLVDDEREVFGQRVNASGAEVGLNDFRLSDMGPDGDPAYDTSSFPAVAYNSAANEYLVVWAGDDNTSPLVDGEFEIFGQRVNASGAEVGLNDFRLSDMGPDGDTAYDAQRPALAYNSLNNEYLVVWQGEDNTGSLVLEEFEVFGQRVSASGTEVGLNDFRLSDMGPDGDPNYDIFEPEVAYNSADNEYLVVWQGHDNTGSLVRYEFEIFGQLVDAATGAEIGGDIRLSDMGLDGNLNYGAALFHEVAYNSTNNEYLVVWDGDDNTPSLVDDEAEIFGQRFASSFSVYLPVILK